MKTEHDNKVYAILGAGGGIGSALARLVRHEGARLALAGRNEGPLAALAAEADATTEVFDATDWDRTEQFLANARRHYGRLDGVAHCVGSLFLKPAHLTDRDQWDQVLHTNLTSAFGVVRAAAKLMRDGGSIVLVSSAAARRGIHNHEAIAAAKAGIIGLTLSAATTYAQRGIRINCVAPGLVETPLTAAFVSNPLTLKAAIAMNPLQRLGEPGDVARAIAWLLDPGQTWITGQVLGVDGGLASLSTRPT